VHGDRANESHSAIALGTVKLTDMPGGITIWDITNPAP
jgi:hypothetical protein